MKLACDVNGSTKMIGILGNPLENSILPQLHNTISRMFGFNLIYIPFCVDEDKLGEAILGLRALNVLGFNITKPYKKEVMKYIDDNMRFSFLMGAIDTVKNIDGRLYGYNIDVEGFIRAAKDANLDFKNKIVTIFGAEGEARAIAVKLASNKVSKINIINRTTDEAKNIKSTINDNIEEVVDIYTYNDKKFLDICKESDVLINATSLGMFPDTKKSIICDEKIFKKNQFVYDIVYTPKSSMFLKMAKKKGCKTIDGLGMIFHQGILSYEIWTGYKFNNNEINKIYDLFKQNRFNKG